MQAIILVGGKGTRLRPLTYTTPKQMLPLVGVPLLESVLGGLAEHGVTDAVLSLGYLPDQFIEAYPDGVIGGVHVTYAVEPTPLDTAGAIRFAALGAGVDETFLVINGDVVTDLDVARLVAFHRERGAEATIGLHAVDDPSRFGVVVTADDGRVEAFVEKPPAREAPTNLINAGVYVMEPSALGWIPEGRPVNVERETFPQMASDGVLFALGDDHYWLDTGTPLTYLQANLDVLDGHSQAATRSPVVDHAWCDPSASIDPSATIRRAVVDHGCVVGAGATVVDSVLLPGVVVHHGAVVRSSIVGSDAVIGAGAVLGPTCVIGNEETVPAGSHLSGDVRLGGV